MQALRPSRKNAKKMFPPTVSQVTDAGHGRQEGQRYT